MVRALLSSAEPFTVDVVLSATECTELWQFGSRALAKETGIPMPAVNVGSLMYLQTAST